MPENPSQTLAFELADSAQHIWTEHTFIPHIFATNWKSAEPELRELYETHGPAVVLHFGIGNQKSALHIERRARNNASTDIDAIGCPGCGGPIHNDGPMEIQTRLALYPLLQEIRSRGINAQLSNSAGSYLCNFLYYNSLLKSRTQGRSPVVTFIHLPTSLCAENPTNSPLKTVNHSTRLNWTDLINAGMILISHSLKKAR